MFVKIIKFSEFYKKNYQPFLYKILERKKIGGKNDKKGTKSTYN